MRLPSRETFGSAVRRLTATCALGALACLSACGLMRGSPTSVGEQVVSNQQGNAPKITEGELQREVQSLCESYVSKVVNAADELVQQVGTPEVRMAAQRWKAGQAASAMAVATGSRATSNLLDLVVLVTLASYAQQDYWSPTYGAADDALLTIHMRSEELVWNLSAKVFPADQLSTLRSALDTWRAQNPGQKYTAFLRLPAFTEIMTGTSGSDPNKKNVVAGLLSLVNVDPFSGLDPATREIERSRMFGERLLFYAERMPMVVSMQLELTVMELGELPDVKSLLESTRTVSTAADSIGELARTLPETLEQQRKGLVSDLEKSQPTLESLLGSTRATLAQANQLSQSLDQLTHSVDGFVGQFREEPGAGAAPGAPRAPGDGVALAATGPEGPPFDIRDYGATARDVTVTAKELNQLVSRIDKTLPEVERVLDDTEARGVRLVDRAFWRGILLISLLLGGGLLVTLAIVSAVRRRPDLTAEAKAEPTGEPTVERGS